MELIWRSSELTSSLHAARAVLRDETIVDPRLAAVTGPAQELAAQMRAAELPTDRFWANLIPLSAAAMGRRLLIETALIKTIGRGPRLEALVSNLAPLIADIEAAIRAAVPNLLDELRLREGPLRGQWEACGNGMLVEIGRLTEDGLIPQQCEALLVLPAIGGAGEAHLAYNSVRIEGVLANSITELPEVVRLAWLISQLQLDLPRYSEEIDSARLPDIARLAMLPPALIAGQAMELTRFAPELIALAAAAWRVNVPAGSDAAAAIMEWWQTYIETRPPWNVALAALNQMLG